MNQERSVEIFISYSHEDIKWWEKLLMHFSTLERQGLISSWHDRKIEGGSEWAGEIDKHINSSEIIILLLSPNFLASNYAFEIEMKRALARHEAGEACVIPIIVRPCEWQEIGTKKLQVLPHNSVAVSKWPDEDDAFLDIITNMRSIIKKLELNEKPSHDLVSRTSLTDLVVLKKDTTISIGVDVGTTKIAAGLVKQVKGKKPEFHSDKIVRIEHDEKKSTEGVLEKIISVIDDVIRQEGVKKEEIDAIGLGLPGQVRRTDGMLFYAPGLQIENYNFCLQLQQHYNVPVCADNDVNCSTFAELTSGLGSLHNNFICMFIGTGIGAGIVVDKKMVRGHNFSAGEVGHMKIDFRPNARECTCGQRGCYEEYASTRAIVRLARIKIFDIIERKMDSRLKDLDPRTIEPKDIVAIMKAGDEEAKELARDIANYLSIGLANMANLLNPEAFILGGGIIEGFYDFPEFEKTVAKKFKAYAVESCAKVSVVKSSFKATDKGCPAPIIGAALIPFESAYVD